MGTVLIQLLLLVVSVRGNAPVGAYQSCLSTGDIAPSAGLCARPTPIKSSAATCLPPLFLSGNRVAERTVRQVVVDIDHDGDPDLIAITNLPRLLVWLNDGTGHFTSWPSCASLYCFQVAEDSDSGGADTPPLFPWLTAEILEGPLVALASAEADLNSPPTSFDCLNQSSPRAPPSEVS